MSCGTANAATHTMHTPLAHTRPAINWRRVPGWLTGWLVVAVTLASASLAAVRVYEIAARAYQHGHSAASRPAPMDTPRPADSGP